MRLEQEARDHAKVAASSAHGPEEIGVLALAGRDKTAIGQDHIGLEQVVDREAILAREVAGAAAQGEAQRRRWSRRCQRGRPARTRGWRDRRRPTCSRRRPERFASPDPRARSSSSTGRSPARRRRTAEAGAIVTAAANREQQDPARGRNYCGDDVGNVDAAGNQSRPLSIMPLYNWRAAS